MQGKMSAGWYDKLASSVLFNRQNDYLCRSKK